jgi:3-dehydroquinate synthase
VGLGARSYVVRIAPGLLQRAGAEIADLLPRPKTWIVTERTVADLHLGR